jgi:hypothetical protein
VSDDTGEDDSNPDDSTAGELADDGAPAPDDGAASIDDEIADDSTGDELSAPDDPAAGSDDTAADELLDDAGSSDPSNGDAGADTSASMDEAADDATGQDRDSGLQTRDEQDEDSSEEVDAGVTIVPPLEPPDDPAPSFDGPPAKLDLLFVIDNSRSMADKQLLLSEALPDLIDRLLSPYCRHPDGTTEPTNGLDDCVAPAVREFAPITDLHVGVITTSLGGYGAVFDCATSSQDQSEQAEDMARMLGSLPRGEEAAPSAASTGFLAWTSGTDESQLVDEFANLVATAGEFGCGWEASLESWVRFLVDPFPYTRIVRQPCNDSDTNDLCAGPETDAAGNQLVDAVLLSQRQAFLRPDSLLSIVMFSDENDCSFQNHGQTWRLAQTVNEDGGFNPAFKGTDACNDPEFGPNHECCHSCGQASAPPAGCPSTIDDQGATVGVGCEDSRRYGLDGAEDHPNLRCLQQKRRFGVDYLMPLERYTNALTLEHICTTNDDLSAEDCDAPLVRNPLFPVIDGERRPSDWVYLVGILGVPWQDLAVDPTGNQALRYRSADPDAEDPINWDWIVGPEQTASGYPEPEDPLMVEQVAARAGITPSTGEALAPPESGTGANSINGHEWSINYNEDLQYACIFPFATPEECISLEEYRNLADMGEAVPSCDCTDFSGEEYKNPLCQGPSGDYGMTQYYGKAYPSLRQLRVLQRYGRNSIVGSICPKEQTPTVEDYGYRPAVAAMIERFTEVLAP